MLKKLDIYIIKKFLGSYFFSIFAIISIAVIFDIQEKIEDFIENDAPLKKIIFDYYLNFIPYFANLFSSLFVFVAVIFFTSKMAANTEIVAMHASGISYMRFLRPYFIASALLALLSLWLIMFVIPNSNKVRLDFEDRYVRNSPYNNRDQDIHKQVQPNEFMYIDSYNSMANVGYRFTLEKFEGSTLISKMRADYIKWDTTKNKWTAYNAIIRTIDGVNETIEMHKKIDTSFILTPDDFNRRDIYVEKMTITELNEFIEKQILFGADNLEVYLVQYHQRWAYPFSTFILTFIGVTLASKKRRAGIGFNIGIGLLLAFTYILFMQVSTTFSINGNVPPIISVWIPNVIYFIFGIGLYFKTAF